MRPPQLTPIVSTTLGPDDRSENGHTEFTDGQAQDVRTSQKLVAVVIYPHL